MGVWALRHAHIGFLGGNKKKMKNRLMKMLSWMMAASLAFGGPTAVTAAENESVSVDSEMGGYSRSRNF